MGIINTKLGARLPDGSKPQAPIKTGQTTDYTPVGRTSKDDGGEQKGITKSYQIFDESRFSGTTNVTVNGNTSAHTNEVVLDKNTGLVWSRDVEDAVFGTGAQRLLWDGSAASDEDIFEYVDQANTAAVAGYTDWRVPNINEISSLIISRESGAAALDATAFNSLSGAFWSSTSQLNITTNGMGISSGDTRILGYAKTTTRSLKLLMVRG